MPNTSSGQTRTHSPQPVQASAIRTGVTGAICVSSISVEFDIPQVYTELVRNTTTFVGLSKKYSSQTTSPFDALQYLALLSPGLQSGDIQYPDFMTRHFYQFCIDKLAQHTADNIGYSAQSCGHLGLRRPMLPRDGIR